MAVRTFTFGGREISAALGFLEELLGVSGRRGHPAALRAGGGSGQGPAMAQGIALSLPASLGNLTVHYPRVARPSRRHRPIG